jgi:hypothetical protein
VKLKPNMKKASINLMMLKKIKLFKQMMLRYRRIMRRIISCFIWRGSNKHLILLKILLLWLRDSKEIIKTKSSIWLTLKSLSTILHKQQIESSTKTQSSPVPMAK